ncbi:MAG: YecA family protein [Zoogloea sp.]|uniref:YecA family protein n=1 Tax=Zoogloea sp. TaxID=49181 RepID=UPI003F2A5E55
MSENLPLSDAWTRLLPRLSVLDAAPLGAALAEALPLRDALADPLLAELQAVVRDPAPACDPGYALHLSALLLLAHWQDSRAHTALLALGALADDIPDQLLGPLLQTSYARCLMATCPASPDGLIRLASLERAHPSARAAALEALALGVLEGRLPRDVVLAFLESFAQAQAAQVAKGVEQDFPFLDLCVHLAAELGAASFAPLLEAWYAADLIDAASIQRDTALAQLARSPEECRAALHQRGNVYIDSPAREIISMDAAYDSISPFARPIPLAALRAPIVREGPKAGRNDPCPCGSGRKYKKCHGAN